MDQDQDQSFQGNIVELPLANKTAPDQPHTESKPQLAIRSTVTDEGLAMVQLETPSTKTIFTADAAAQIALELLSASYASRSEKALRDYIANLEPERL